MLWQNIIGIEGIDQNNRAVDVGVMFSRGEKKHIYMLQEKVVFQQVGIAGLQKSSAIQGYQVSAVL